MGLSHTCTSQVELQRGGLLLRSDVGGRTITQGTHITQELGRTALPGVCSRCCCGRLQPSCFQGWGGMARAGQDLWAAPLLPGVGAVTWGQLPGASSLGAVGGSSLGAVPWGTVPWGQLPGGSSLGAVTWGQLPGGSSLGAVPWGQLHEGSYLGSHNTLPLPHSLMVSLIITSSSSCQGCLLSQ